MRYRWRRVAAALCAALLAAGGAEAQSVARPLPFPIDLPGQFGPVPLRNRLPGVEHEQWEMRGANGRGLRNIRNPTLTPVLPDAGRATGAAVIIAPGGAFRILAMDNEGFDVARMLASRGIAAFVLKYRTIPTPRDSEAFLAAMARAMAAPRDGTRPPDVPRDALEDAEAAVRLVRTRAARWRVDPERVGFLGFSAGAILALDVGLSGDKSARPDFVGSIYGPMMKRAVPEDAPALFAAIALDDPLFARGKELGLIESWRNAGRPLEAHLYDRGGHGFAMQRSSAASELWVEEFLAWMRDRRLTR
ncbi:alpha/beta hydrolase [uncultured Sphingomonas sp.]|uniref:alpha/beta hydrolase n=1 Tax=uncultured Sphingomonas sp. TaxID=158754 RepID=UPI0025D2C325|nr:alpha/beta hydrolase [uncultured Sphingomonas sp.]